MPSESKSLQYLIASIDQRLFPDNQDYSKSIFSPGFISESLRKKLFILRLLIESVQNDIYERKSLEQRVLDEMDQSIMQIHNEILSRKWITERLIYSGRLNPEVKDFRIKEADIEVEKARIKERSEKDQLELKRERRKLLREYLEALEHIRLFK